MEWFPFLMMFALVPVAWWFHQKAEAAWREAARRLGARYTPGGVFSQREITGRYEGFDLRVWPIKKGSGKNKSTYTKYALSGAVTLDLELSREDFWTEASKAIGRADLELGDRSFDDAVYLKGDETVALALLDKRTRRQLTVAVNDGMRVEAGQVSIERSGMVRDADALVSELEPLAAVARRLPAGAKIEARLLQAVEAKEPDAYRVACLRELGNRAGKSQAVRELCRRLLDNTHGTRALRAEALEILIFQDEIDSPALEKLSRSSAPVAYVAVRGLLRRDETPPEAGVETLLGAGEAYYDIAAEAAARHGDRFESTLLRCLTPQLGDAPRLALIEALGAVASPLAVETLLAHSKGLTTPSIIKEAATQAVAAIQARVGRVEQGALAVSEGDRGELSVSDPTPE